MTTQNTSYSHPLFPLNGLKNRLYLFRGMKVERMTLANAHELLKLPRLTKGEIDKSHVDQVISLIRDGFHNNVHVIICEVDDKEYILSGHYEAAAVIASEQEIPEVRVVRISVPYLPIAQTLAFAAAMFNCEEKIIL